jgi:hypothetical protein
MTIQITYKTGSHIIIMYVESIKELPQAGYDIQTYGNQPVHHGAVEKIQIL